MKAMIAVATAVLLGAAACNRTTVAEDADNDGDADRVVVTEDDDDDRVAFNNPAPAAPETDPYDTMPDGEPVDASPPTTAPPGGDRDLDDPTMGAATTTGSSATVVAGSTSGAPAGAPSTTTTTQTTTATTQTTTVDAKADQALGTRSGFQDFIAVNFATADANDDSTLSREEYALLATSLASVADANIGDQSPPASPPTVDAAFKQQSGTDAKLTEGELRTALLEKYDEADVDNDAALSMTERKSFAALISFADDTPAEPPTN